MDNGARRGAWDVPGPVARARTWRRAVLGGAALAWLLLLAVGGAARAADLYWNAEGGEWEDAANWTPGATPSESDVVYVDNHGLVHIGQGVEGLAHSLFIGDRLTGRLSLTDGGKATLANSIDLGYSENGLGAATVDGAGSTLENKAGHLYIGRSGEGRLSLTDGGKATSANDINLGYSANALGAATVDGAGSTLESKTGYLYIGDVSEGRLSLTDGGIASAHLGVRLGFVTGSLGTATVDGAGSVLESKTNPLIVGQAGEGRLSLTGGGKASTSQNIRIGNDIGSLGTVTMDGAGSTLEGEKYYIGIYGEGRLSLTGGAVASAVASGSAYSLYIGREVGSLGSVTVNGSGSALIGSGGYFGIGVYGEGRLSLTGGGTATGSTIFLGYEPGSRSVVTVGSGSSLRAVKPGNGLGVVIVGGSLDSRNLPVNGGRSLLAGSGSVVAEAARGVFVLAPGTLSAGDRAGDIGVLTIGEIPALTPLKMFDKATLRVDLAASGASDRIVVEGAATIGGINVDVSHFREGSFLFLSTRLGLSLSGAATVTANGEAISRAPRASGMFANVSLPNLFGLWLNIAASPANDTVAWKGTNEANGVGAWNLSTKNWSHASGYFWDGDAVVFDDNNKADAKNGHTITLGGNGKTVASMMVQGKQDWTFVGDILADGELSTLTLPHATGTLTMGGTGTLTLKGENTFAGGVELHSGVLVLEREWNLGTTLSGLRFLSDAGAAGTKLGTLRVADGKKLFFNGTSVDDQRLAIGTDTTAGGGAIALGEKASLTFANNKAAGTYGGALAIQKNSSLALTAGAGARFVFEDNQAHRGGAFWNYGTLSIGKAEFRRNRATGEQGRGGAAYNVNAESVLTFTDTALFDQNRADNYGGAFYAYRGVAKFLGAARFTANEAASGGAMYIQQEARVDLSGGGLFSGNRATLGGAVYQNTAGANNRVAMSGVAFDGNTARAGGAYYHQAGVLALTDVVFDGNRAVTDVAGEDNEARGGALHVAGAVNDTQVTLHNATFTGNQAYDAVASTSSVASGGALYMAGGQVKFTGATLFTDNKASATQGYINRGGAVYYAAGGDLRFDGATTFQGNVATDGGAIFAAAALDLSSSTGTLLFVGNKGDSGGGIYSESVVGTSSVTLGDLVTFSGNTASYHGGGINSHSFLDPSSVTLGDLVTFSGNTAGGDGGGIFSQSNSTSSVTLGDLVTFSGNTAVDFGGGILSESSSTSSVILGDSALFTGNTAGYFGGGIFSASSSSASLTLGGNTFFRNNLAGRDGGAIYFSGSSGSSLMIDASAGAVAFSGNRSGVTFENGKPVDGTGTANSIHLTQNVKLDLKGDSHFYFDDPISSPASGTDSGNTLAKAGAGFVQFVGDSYLNQNAAHNHAGGAVGVAGGRFRVVEGASFNAYGAGATFTAAAGTVLAGGGTIAAQQGFMISGTISPDADRFEIPEYVDRNHAEAAADRYNYFKAGRVEVAEAKKIATLSLVGDATFNAAALAVDIASAAVHDRVAVDGDVAFSGAGRVDAVFADGRVVAGVYDLVTATGALSVDPAASWTYSLGAVFQDGYNLGARGTGVAVNGQSLRLTVDFQNLPLTWTGAVGAAWSGVNWISGGANPETRFSGGDAVSFDDSTAARSVDIDANALVAGLSVSGGAAYTFGGVGGLTGTADASRTTIANPTGELSVTGNSTAVFANAGANGFVATRIASGSTIRLDGAGNLGGAIVNAGDFIVNRSNAYTLDNAISGAGTTKMTGTGTLTLSGTNAQSNAFEQSAGTVNLQKTWTGSYAQSAGYLTGDGNGRIVGDASFAGTVRAYGLTVDGDVLLNGTTIDVDTAATTGALVVTGDVTSGGVPTIDILDFKTGTYTVVTAASFDFATDQIASYTTLVGGSVPTGRQTVDYSGSTNTAVVLKLVTAGGNLKLAWAGADGDSWRNRNQWTHSAPNDETFSDGDAVTFDTTVATPQTIELGTGVVRVADMTVRGGDFAFAGAAGLHGSTSDTTLADAGGKLDIGGSGTKVTLANTGANSFAATTIGQGATLQLGDGDATGSLQGGIANAGSLVLARAGSYTLDNTITGGGTVTLNDLASVTTFAGSSTNRFIQNGGTLDLTGSLAGGIAQNAGTTNKSKLTGNGTIGGVSTFSGIVAPTGTLTVAAARLDGMTLHIAGLGSDTLAITGSADFGAAKNTLDLGQWATGAYTVIAGQAGFDFSGVFADAITLNGNPLGDRQRAVFSTTNDDLEVTLSNSNAMRTWTGNADGWWNTTAENWLEGDKKFIDGDLVAFVAGPVNRHITIQSGGVTVGDMTVDGADGYIFDGGSITGDPASYSGPESVSGKLTKKGAGTLTLNNANDFAGGADLLGGMIELGNAGALGAKAIHMSVGTTLSFKGGYTLGNVIAFNGAATLSTGANGVTLDGILQGPAGFAKTGVGALTLSGANTYGGGTTISEGGIVAKNASALGTGAVDLGANALDLDFAGALNSGNALLGTGSLNLKNNVTLNHANAGFTGAAGVDAGKTLTLGHAAALSSARLTLASGATLSVGQATAVAALSANGATLNLGSAANTISAGAFALGGANTVQIDVAAPGTHTLLRSTGGAVSAWNAVVANANAAARGSTKTTAHTLDYRVLAAGAADLVWTGAAGSAWNASGLNWRDADDFAFAFVAGDNVLFDATAANRRVEIDAAGVTAGRMTVDVGAGFDYTFDGGAVAGTLVKNGAGTATFNAANGFASVTVDGGRVDVGHADALGAGALSFADGTTLGFAGDVSLANAFNASGKVVVDVGANAAGLSGAVSGDALEKRGSGSLAVGDVDASSFAVAAGRLEVGKDNTVTASGVVSFAEGTTLGLSQNLAVSAGALSLGGNTTLDLTSISGPPYARTTLLISRSAIAGSFASIMVGGVDQSGSMTHDKYVNDVIVQKSADEKSYQVHTGGLVWNNTAPNTAHGTFNVATSFTVAEALADNADAAAYFDGWDGQSLTKRGVGELTLSAANTHSGATTVEAGTLALGHAGAAANSALSVESEATLRLSQASSARSLKADGAILDLGAGHKLTVGSAVLTGDNTVKIAIGAAGTYVLIDSGAEVASWNAAVVDGGNLRGGVKETTRTLEYKALAAGAAANLRYTGGGAWNTTDRTWDDGGFAFNFADGDHVAFDGAVATVDRAVALAGDVTVGNMTVGGDGYRFDGGEIDGDTLTLVKGTKTTFGDLFSFDAIGGEGALVYDGAAALTLDGANTATGAFGQTGKGAVTLATNWDGDYTQAAGAGAFSATDGARIGGDASFAGEATMTGTVSIGGDASFAGEATMTGTVSVGGDAAFAGEATMTGTVSIGGDASFADAASVAGTFSVDGDVGVSMGGSLTLAYGAALTAATGQVTLADGATLSFALPDAYEAPLAAATVTAAKIKLGAATLTADGGFLASTNGAAEVSSVVMRATGDFALDSGATLAGARPWYDYAFALDAGTRELTLTVTPTGVDYATFASGRNSRSLAAALDRARASGGVVFKDELDGALRGIVNAATPGESSARLTELSPAALAGGTALSPMAATRFGADLGHFWRDKRLDDEARNKATNPATSASNATGVSGTSGAADIDAWARLAADAPDRGWRFWGRTGGAWSEYDSPNGEPGHTAKEWTATVAGYRSFGAAGSDAWSFGAALHFNHTKLDWEKSLGETKGDSFAGALMTMYERGAWFAALDATWGATEIESRRRLPLAGLRANADYRTHWYGADLTAGYRAKVGAWSLTPAAGARWYRHDTPGVTEKGAGAAGLTMRRHHRTGVEVFARLDVSRTWRLANGASLTPRGYVGVSVEAADRWATPTMNFAGGPTGLGSFLGYSPKVGRTAGQLGLGLEAKFHERWTAHAEYAAEFRDRQQSHAGQLGLALAF